MSGPSHGRPLFQVFWYLYMVLGGISTAVGVLLVCAPGFVFPAARSEHSLIRIIGLVFLVFGITRIVNAFIQVRRMNGSASAHRKSR